MISDNNQISAAEIRAIRRSLGETQEQFSVRLGVSKVTVARWESGTRRCRGHNARRVVDQQKSRITVAIRSTTIFSVDPDDLARFDPRQAVEAMRDLLRCVVRRLGLSARRVEISFREIADGGIDAHVSGVPAQADVGLLAEGENSFQIKSGTSAKPWQNSWVQGELFGSSGKQIATRERLATEVKHCLDNNGRFVVVFFGLDLTPEQIREARTNIIENLQLCGYHSPRVEVFGQQQLIAFFSEYPSLCLSLTRRADFEFQSLESWALSQEMSPEFRADDARLKVIEEIRTHLRNDEIRHIRLVGEPGLGKTRLVLEAVSVDDISPCIIYVRNADSFLESRLCRDLLRPNAEYFVILVLDECSPRDCQSIWNVLRARSSHCRILTIDHNQCKQNDPWAKELECPRLANKGIVDIIASYVGPNSDAERWAEFCSGSPRVAHAVGENLKYTSGQILQVPSPDHLWGKFIAGYQDPNAIDGKRTQVVLRHAALFSRFGFEGTAELQAEARFIAGLIHETDPTITESQFQSIVHELKLRRILQGQKTLFIVPRLLQIYLWKEFWEHHGRGKLLGLMESLPPSLAPWFVEMLQFAHESKVATAEIEQLLGHSGPFSDRQFACSPFGCRLIDTLAEAAPEATLTCLERTIGCWDRNALLDFQDERQHIVWALEKIAVYKDLFERAARILLRLADAETAQNSNNATGTFAALFSLLPGIACTEASPERRLPVLCGALDSNEPNDRRIALKACRNALSLNSGTRIVGVEYQGLRPTARFWMPQTWGDVFSAWHAVWSSLWDTTRHWDDELRREANGVLIECGSSVLNSKFLADAVLTTFEKLILDPACDKRMIIEEITQIRKFWANEYPGEVIERLRALDDAITGSTYVDRVNRHVHFSSYDDQVARGGGVRKEFSNAIQALARESIHNPASFMLVLPQLVVGSNSVLFTFGCEIARLDPDRDFLQVILQSYRDANDRTTHAFLAGYLAAVFMDDRAVWERIIIGVIGERSFAAIAGDLVVSSGLTDAAVKAVCAAFDASQLTSEALLPFRYSSSIRELERATVLGVLERLFIGDKTSDVLEMLMHVYCGKREKGKLPEDIALAALRGKPNDGGARRHDEYVWNEVACEFISQFPNRMLDLFSIVIDRICRDNWFWRSHNRTTDVVKQIIYAHPSECWTVVSARLESKEMPARRHLLDWLAPPPSFGHDEITGPLEYFQIERVLEWVDSAPASRASLIARAVPKMLAREGNGRFTRELLIRYGDDADLCSVLHGHFWSGGWSGKASEYYRGKRDTALKWLESESSLKVRTWIEKHIAMLSDAMKRAEIEEERTWDN